MLIDIQEQIETPRTVNVAKTVGNGFRIADDRVKENNTVFPNIIQLEIWARQAGFWRANVTGTKTHYTFYPGLRLKKINQ